MPSYVCSTKSTRTNECESHFFYLKSCHLKCMSFPSTSEVPKKGSLNMSARSNCAKWSVPALRAQIPAFPNFPQNLTPTNIYPFQPPSTFNRLSSHLRHVPVLRRPAETQMGHTRLIAIKITVIKRRRRQSKFQS